MNIQVDLPDEMLSDIDRCRRECRPVVSRAEMIRKLIEIGLIKVELVLAKAARANG
jgi:metal-responsive CopG/Arc/MetJ family transcriptional regulator